MHQLIVRMRKQDAEVGTRDAIYTGMSTIIGVPVWHDQVSTTLDFARKLLIVEADGECEVGRKEVALIDEAAEKKALRIRDLAVQVLLCGAISQPLARAIAHTGIRIVPYVTGEVDQVLAAYLCGRLAEPCFLQPGCHPGARRRWLCRGGFCGGRSSSGRSAGAWLLQ